MRRKHLNISHLQPGLFDSIEDLAETGSGDFKIIPADRESEIARLEAERRARAIDDMPPMQRSDHIFFMSFGSGSSGNCSYLGDRESGFLIDAGIDARRVMTDLRDNGIMPEQIKGIILTHDHHDHISQVYPLLRNNRHVRLYCTPRTLNGILRRHNVSRRIKDYHVPVYKEFPFTIGDFSITPFEVLHDGADNVGFFIEHGSQTVALATDLGRISERADFYIRQAQTVVIESNYDLEKLIKGAYPEHLKARILHEKGHLDNNVSAEYMASIYSASLRNIFLCHLSHDNNTPALALEAYRQAFVPLGVSRFAATTIPFGDDFDADSPRPSVIPLPRYERTPLYTL